MTAPQADPGATAEWCRDPSLADAVAALFVECADVGYISHSELQTGRAIDRGTWARDRGEQVRRLAIRAAQSGSETADGMGLATLSNGGRLLGFAFVAFTGSAATPYAALEDLLIVRELRGTGCGSRFLHWIAAECRSRGARRLFLESGAGNGRAHGFFAREGFQQTSIVMMRDL